RRHTRFSRDWSSDVCSSDLTRVVVAGAGAAGVAVTRMLQSMNLGDIVVLDSKGAIHRKRGKLSPVKRELAESTNAGNLQGGPARSEERRVGKGCRSRRSSGE